MRIRRLIEDIFSLRSVSLRKMNKLNFRALIFSSAALRIIQFVQKLQIFSFAE